LAGARIGHLSTADSSGAAHVIPICYAFDGDFIYSVLDQKPKRTSLTRLRRVKNILANPQVALVVDHYEEDWSRLWYILVTGHAELLLAGDELEGDEREQAIVKLREKYQQYRDMDIDMNPVIKIIPDKVVSWGI
jgi:PPOX class probable F420-dependent enzyme